MDPSVREQLRVLWKTLPYTPHAIAAHPRVPESTLDALRAAMKAMGEDPEGAQRQKALRIVGLEAAQDAQWNDVRALRRQLSLTTE